MRNKKDTRLEAIRGLAACSVMVWHSLVAFFPRYAGIIPSSPLETDVKSKIWFGLLSGSGAVTLFFVLSGYVLTRSYFLSGDGSIIARGFVKRWPRLAGPVLISTLISWALFKLNLMFYYPAAAITESPWLRSYGYAMSPEAAAVFQPTIWHAIYQGALHTFFVGTNNDMNNNIWTMHFETVGSFIVFGMALLFNSFRVRKMSICIYVFIIISFLCYTVDVRLCAFPFGVMVAFCMPERSFKIPLLLAIVTGLFAVYLLGYEGQSYGAYRQFHNLMRGVISYNLVEIIAASTIILIVENSDYAEKFFSRRFFSWLGNISFPLYLMHLIIIASLGSYVAIITKTTLVHDLSMFVALLSTIIISFLASLPIAMFNDRWVVIVNNSTRHFLQRKSSPLDDVDLDAYHLTDTERI